MMTFSRAMDIAESEWNFDKTFKSYPGKQGYVLDISVMYAIGETVAECDLRTSEQAAQQRMEQHGAGRPKGTTTSETPNDMWGTRSQQTQNDTGTGGGLGEGWAGVCGRRK